MKSTLTVIGLVFAVFSALFFPILGVALLCALYALLIFFDLSDLEDPDCLPMTTIGRAVVERFARNNRRIIQLEAQLQQKDFQIVDDLIVQPIDDGKEQSVSQWTWEQINKQFSTSPIALIIQENSKVTTFCQRIDKQRIEGVLLSRYDSFFYKVGSDRCRYGLVRELQQEGAFSLLSLGITHAIAFPVYNPSTPQRKMLLWVGYEFEPTITEVTSLARLSEKASEKMSAEERIKELNNEVLETKERSAQREKLFSHLAHDIRTPINNIRSLIELLLMSTEDEEEQTIYKSAQSNCDGLAELFQDMLYYLQEQSSCLRAEPKRFDLNKLIEDTVAGLQLKAKSNNLNLYTRLEADIELTADKGHIRRILTNLISNSLKYTKHGECCVSASLSLQGDLYLSVKDTGLGMTREQVDSVFQPFVRHHRTQADGLGLGMAVFHMLVTKNNGTITVDSEVGKGTEVRIVIPSKYIRKDVKRIGHKHAKVLLVDDDKDLVDSCAKILSQGTLQVLTASTVEEALAIIEKEEIDVLMTDSNMPNGGGERLVRVFRKKDAKATVFVISGSDDPTIRAIFQTLNITRFITKPADFSDLRSWIESGQEREDGSFEEAA